PPAGRVRALDSDGRPVAGIVDGSRIFLESGDEGARPVLAEASATYVAPLEHPPSKIIGVHLNFPSRIEEYGAKTPPEPSYFLKPPSSLNSHRGTIARPAGTTFLNYEGEVALVIGARARRVRLEDALAHVAGYTVADDFGLHDFRHADRGSMLR